MILRDRRDLFFFFQAEDGIRDLTVTGVQTCALPIWLRARRLRRVHHPRRRAVGALLPDARGAGERARDRDGGRPRALGRAAAPAAGGIPRQPRPPVRLLHAGDADDAGRVSARSSEPDRRGGARGDLRQSVPVHRVSGHRRRGAGRRWAHAQGRLIVGMIGSRVERLEDRDLLRGKGRFVDDVVLPNMLHAAFVRSPHGHAAIRGIAKAQAAALPGVHAVLAREDLLPHLRNERLVVGLPSKSYKQDLNRPVLAIDEVVHVGEPVAIVVADDRYVAEDGAALVEIEYDPLPAVADCRAALAPGAPVVHRGAPHNLLAEFRMGYGDADAAFAKAAHVFSESLWQHRGGSHSIECRGAVAAYDAIEDRLTLWSSTQMPHQAMRQLCDMLGRDENRVRVVTPDIGGGFGPKLVFYPEDVATALAAIILGRPVKWIEDRREHFVATTQERDQYWDVEIAVDRDARILGIRGTIVHDHGAYTARGVNLPHNSAETVPLQYDVPAYAMNVRVALTNKVPVTPVRGAGHPQGTFAIERLLDRVARELKVDRAEVRRRNLIPPEKMPYKTRLKARGGQPVLLDSGDYPRCPSEALARTGR